MYGMYANIWGILMVNVTIYNIHGSYGIYIYIFTGLYRSWTPPYLAIALRKKAYNISNDPYRMGPPRYTVGL